MSDSEIVDLLKSDGVLSHGEFQTKHSACGDIAAEFVGYPYADPMTPHPQPVRAIRLRCRVHDVASQVEQIDGF